MSLRRVRRSDLSLSFEPDGRVLARATASGVGARLPPIAVGILAFCGEPRTADDVARQFGPQGAQLYAGLADAGLLVEPEEARATPRFFENFASLDVHRRMLADHHRVDAYARALAEVAAGRVVLDAGTGSGILALLAAKAGARRVFAVDAAEIVELAREVVAANGLADVIEVTRSDVARFAAPEPVGVIVTETFGAFALAEGAMDDVLAAAARNLEVDGIVVPSAIELRLAPVGDPAVHAEALGPFQRADVDLSPLANRAMGRAITLDVPASSLAHPGARLARLPFPTGGSATSGEVVFAGLPEGSWYGLAGWFVLELSPSVTLPTGPADPPTHWKQCFLPIAPVPVPVGATLRCEVEVAPPPDDRRALEVRWTWSLEHEDGGPIASGEALHRIR